jgi:excisionase family DNA binding protein
LKCWYDLAGLATPGFHSHDDDFLYEVQRRDRKESAPPPPPTQRPPSIHRQTKAAAKAAMDAIVSLAEQPERAEKATQPIHSSELPPKLAFTLKEAAQFLGVKVWFLRKAIHESRLPAKLAGQKHLILRDDLVRFFQTLPDVAPRKP